MHYWSTIQIEGKLATNKRIKTKITLDYQRKTTQIPVQF